MSPSSPTHEEASAKDLKFVMIEKENAPVNQTERLVMTKDTGKQFMSAAPASASGNTEYYQVLLLLLTLQPRSQIRWNVVGNVNKNRITCLTK